MTRWPPFIGKSPSVINGQSARNEWAVIIWDWEGREIRIQEAMKYTQQEDIKLVKVLAIMI